MRKEENKKGRRERERERETYIVTMYRLCSVAHSYVATGH